MRRLSGRPDIYRQLANKADRLTGKHWNARQIEQRMLSSDFFTEESRYAFWKVWRELRQDMAVYEALGWRMWE